MIKKLLFASLLTTSCIINSMGQTINLHSGNTSMLTKAAKIWDRGIKAAAYDTTGHVTAPCGGDDRQMIWNYNVDDWWGGGAFDLTGWGYGKKQDYSQHNYLKVTYKWEGPADDPTLSLFSEPNTLSFSFTDSITGTTYLKKWDPTDKNGDGTTKTIAQRTAFVTSKSIQIGKASIGKSGCVTRYIPLSDFVGFNIYDTTDADPKNAIYPKNVDFSNIQALNWGLGDFAWDPDPALAAHGKGTFFVDDIQIVHLSDAIAVEAGSSAVGPGESYDFGNITSTSTLITKTFTIRNIDNSSTLTLGTPVISGTDLSDFTITGSLPGTLAAGGTASFTVTFNTSSEGIKNAVLTIPNSFSGGGNYVIDLTGEYNDSEINVKAGTTSVAYKATVDFGGFVVGVTTPTDSTFTIENLGTTTLTLTGTPVDLWGADMADFTIVHPSVNSVAAAGTTTFTIAFNPSTVGVKNAAITIGSNDKDEASYVFYLTGTGNAPEPEINVQAGTTSVASGATVDFGSLVSGTSKDSTFTIENLGTLDLTLSGTPAVSISGDVTEFTIVQTGVTSPVSISGTTSFTVTYNPTSAGIKNATITIANDDIDESSYTINLTGTATLTAEPEINVKEGSTAVLSGGSVNFSSSNVGTTTAAMTFTIENLGTADLTLSGIAISGDAGDFTIDETLTTSPVAAAGTTTFTVTFNPTATGSRTADITISNDDTDEGTYVITLTGTGTAPEIDVTVGTGSIASAGTYNFVNTVNGSSSAATTFTIKNLGDGVLALSGSPKIDISGDVTDFTIVQAGVTSTVAAAGTTTFTVTFNPTATGSRTADITIANDDSDEGTYVITLTGTGTIAGLFGSSNNAGSDTYAAYPTPFTDEAVIKVNSTVNAPMSIKVIDTKGTVVGTTEDHFTNEDVTLGKGLEKGIYFVHVAYQNRVQVIKIVKM